MAKQQRRSNPDFKDKKTRPSNRRNKSQSKQKSNKSFDLDSVRETEKSTNDEAWYATNDVILKDAASIPFSWALGTATDLVGAGQEIINDFNALGGGTMYSNKYDKDHVYPGIMSLSLVPTFGYSDNPNSPLNVASMQLYSFVRHANAGHANYDATDLFIYVTGMASVYSFINWAQRIYGLATMFNQKNRYLPRGVIEANDVNFDDVIHNLANFRYGLNVIINKAAAMAVPATMTYFNREAFLYKNLYIESADIKAQLYQYVPVGFMKFGLDDQGAGSLTFQALNTTDHRMTVQEILTYGNNLLFPYLEDEDLGIMSGDILKSYGDKIIKLMPLSEDYIVPAVYDPTVLYQMKNATMGEVNFNSIKLTQNSTDFTGWLESKPVLDHPNDAPDWIMRYEGASNHVLSTDDSNPGPGTVIESTRLMYSIGEKLSDGSYPLYCGTELVTKLSVTTMVDGLPVTDGDFGYVLIYTDGEDAGRAYSLCYEHIYPYVNLMGKLAMFKFHPSISVWLAHIVSGSISALDQWARIFEVDNYAILDRQDIMKMHESALLNLFNVKAIGSV